MHRVRSAHPEDLIDRTDLDALLRRFYGRVLSDDVLAEPFAGVQAAGLDTHLPTMCDFWETVLFRSGRYRGSAMTAHRNVYHRTPLSARHFLRWLSIWYRTVDEMYRGPAAERAKLQATRIAWAMHRQLAAVESTELDALVKQSSRAGRAPDRI